MSHQALIKTGDGGAAEPKSLATTKTTPKTGAAKKKEDGEVG